MCIADGIILSSMHSSCTLNQNLCTRFDSLWNYELTLFHKLDMYNHIVVQNGYNNQDSVLLVIEARSAMAKLICKLYIWFTVYPVSALKVDEGRCAHCIAT